MKNQGFYRGSVFFENATSPEHPYQEILGRLARENNVVEITLENLNWERETMGAGAGLAKEAFFVFSWKPLAEVALQDRGKQTPKKETKI